MGLSSFTPATDKVALPGGGEFAVRGLSLEDLTVLMRSHYKPMVELFDRYVNEAALEKMDADVTGGSLGLGDMEGVVLDVLQVAPGLLGDVIARAADETEDPALARRLPIAVQIDAIEKIVTLTLQAEGGLEKLVETVTKLAAGMTTLAAGRSR